MAISLEKSTLLTIYYITLLDYQGGLLPVYVGRAIAGSKSGEAVWQIQKITYDANNNPTSVLFANSTNSFVNVWDMRCQYNYG